MKGLGWWALLIISHSWETHLFFITGLKLLQLRSRVTTLHQFGVAEELFPVLSSSVLTASSSLQNSQSWSRGSGGQLVALLYKSQGGFGWFPGTVTNQHSPAHKRAQHWAGTNTQHLQRGVAPRQGWPHGQGWALPGLEIHGALQCPVLSVPVSRSSNIPKNTRVKFCPQLPAWSSH